MASPPFDSFSWEIGRLGEHLVLVKNDVRPIAHVSVRFECYGEIKIILDRENIKYIVAPQGETHLAIYLYKYSHLAEVIRHHLGLPAKEKIVEAWFNGKMFGYSEVAIAEYINRTIPAGRGSFFSSNDRTNLP